MPPKTVIKLKAVKTETPIKVDSDDVEIPDKEIINIKPNSSSSSIISKPLTKIPEPIIQDEQEQDEQEQDEQEQDEQDKPIKKTPITDVSKEKDIKISKPHKIIKKSETLVIDGNESVIEPKIEPKTEPKTETKAKQITKTKTLLKQTDSSFDMFGDDKDDYREILMKYDYTKNKTLPKITKYERALLVGKRAKQIEDGANPNVKVKSGQGSIEIAEEELRQRVIPLIIKRPNGNTFEYWKPADMEVLMD